VAASERAGIEDRVTGHREVLCAHALFRVTLQQLEHVVAEDAKLLPVVAGHAVPLPRQLLPAQELRVHLQTPTIEDAMCPPTRTGQEGETCFSQCTDRYTPKSSSAQQACDLTLGVRECT
jgi:hypothetical protein